MEAFGRALALEPYLATVVLGGGAAAARRQRGAARSASVPKIAERRAARWPSRMPSGRRATISPTSRRRPRSDGGGLRPRRREERRAARRQRRQADRVGARLPGGRATATASALFLVDAKAAGRVAARLSDAWTACAPPRSRFASVRVGPDAVLGEPGKALAADRARRRRGDRGAVRRGGRRDGGDARADRRLPEDAQAVRRADRQLPGAAAPRRRHADRARAGAQHGDARHHDGRGGRRRRAAPARSRPPRCRSAAPAASSASRRSSCMAASA